MLKSTLRHLYRDRRRMALTWALLVASNVAGFDTLADPAPWLSAELALSLLIFLAVPLISVVLTRHRHWTEIVATATFIFLLLGIALPDSPFDHTGPRGFSLASWGLYGVLILAARSLLYGSWSDRFTPRGHFRVRSRLITTADIKPLWYGLVPTPGQIDFSPDPEVVSIDYADAARRTVRLVTWLPPRGAGELLLHIHEIEPFRRVRLSMETLRGPTDAGTRGETLLEVVDMGRERHVRMRHTYENGFPPRRLLRAWLDDTFGRMMDARLEAIEISARCPGAAKAKVSFDSWYPDPHDAHPVSGPARAPSAAPSAAANAAAPQTPPLPQPGSPPKSLPKSPRTRRHAPGLFHKPAKRPAPGKNSAFGRPDAPGDPEATDALGPGTSRA